MKRLQKKVNFAEIENVWDLLAFLISTVFTNWKIALIFLIITALSVVGGNISYGPDKGFSCSKDPIQLNKVNE